MKSMGPSGGMVDAGDSKSPAARRAGSSPALGTKLTSSASCIILICKKDFVSDDVEVYTVVFKNSEYCGRRMKSFTSVGTF